MLLIQIIYTLPVPPCTIVLLSTQNTQLFTLYFHFYANPFSKHFHNKISISSIPTIHWLDTAPATTQAGDLANIPYHTRLFPWSSSASISKTTFNFVVKFCRWFSFWYNEKYYLFINACILNSTTVTNYFSVIINSL